MKIKTVLGTAIVAGALTVSSVAGAAVTVNPDGTGFVGKGDVQIPFGWNNKALQDNAGGVTFAVSETIVETSEISWTCTNSNNDNLQVRERTTTETTETQGVFSSIARDGKKQITGFNLLGFSGTPTISSDSDTDGPAVDSCPSGPWALTAPAGDAVIVSSETVGGVFATHNSVTHQIG